MAILIVILYAVIITLKQIFIDNKTLNLSRDITLDSLQFIIYLILFLTLSGTLIYFKVLEKRHQMQIKKLQVLLAFLFGFLTMIVMILRQSANYIIMGLRKDS